MLIQSWPSVILQINDISETQTAVYFKTVQKFLMSSFLSKNRGEWSELYVVTSLLAHDFLTYSMNDGEQKHHKSSRYLEEMEEVDASM